MHILQTSSCVLNADLPQEVERANRLDDTTMTDRERALNAQLLQAATQIVGQPKQMTIDWGMSIGTLTQQINTCGH
eukprot:152387-Pelagomonas_calceolata.AAC.1